MIDQGAIGPMLIRPLTNAADLAEWAMGEGFADLRPSAWHLSVARIHKRPHPIQLDSSPVALDPDRGRTLARRGGLVALEFGSHVLSDRHETHRLAGATWDFAIYRPHVSFMVDDGRDLRSARPFSGPLMFGPEIFDISW